ncbi:hypothetical protein QJS66_16615 [Kocuria rhizophila]|nr:hypothetical protein QJS66_16615 [Kocuria rhizophila]
MSRRDRRAPDDQPDDPPLRHPPCTSRRCTPPDDPQAWQNDGLQQPPHGPQRSRGGSASVPVLRPPGVFGHQPAAVPLPFQYTDTPTARTGAGACGRAPASSPSPWGALRARQWFVGRATSYRRTSTCPDPRAASSPPRRSRTSGRGRPGPRRVRPHMLAAMPAGAFPEWTDGVFRFLQRHAPAVELDEDLA